MEELVDAARELNDAVNMIEIENLNIHDRVLLTKLNKEIAEIAAQVNKLRPWML